MRSNFFRTTALSALTIALTALTVSCAKPKKPDTDAGNQMGGTAGESAPSTPAIENKDNSTDPLGSDSGNIAGLSTIFFEYDQARLTNDARSKLAANADWIKGHPAFTIQIEGHTDSRGSVEYNLTLGERRAKAVKTYLEGLGIDGKRMNIISYGEEKPIVQGDGETAWSKNRRANFVPLQ
jgi:peptidoglycan-associated lipoprotein